MKTDMSPEAISERLQITSELRRLCLALMENGYIDKVAEKKTHEQSHDRPG